MEEKTLKVADLKPFMKKVNIKVKAVGKNEIREVTSRLDNKTHKVTEAVVGDDTGTVLLTLWDEKIGEAEIGKTYDIENGFTSLFKRSIRLNIGRFGKMTETSQAIETVNEENNVSEKEFE